MASAIDRWADNDNTLWAEGLDGRVEVGDVLRLGPRRIRVVTVSQYMDLALIHYTEVRSMWQRFKGWLRRG